MNKRDLVAEISRRTGVGKGEVAAVVDVALDVIRRTVAAGERVSLSGFGSFRRLRRGRRVARNPRTPDVPIPIPARDVPAFRPGKAFREAVSGRRRRARSLASRRARA